MSGISLAGSHILRFSVFVVVLFIAGSLWSAEVKRNHCQTTLRESAQVVFSLVAVERGSSGNWRLLWSSVASGCRYLQFPYDPEGWRDLVVGGTYLFSSRLMMEPTMSELEGFARSVGAAGTISPPVMPSLEKNPPAIEMATAQLRNDFRSRLAQLFPGSIGDLLPALIWGDTATLSVDWLAEMQIAGIGHLVAISGGNFTLVLSLLGRLWNGASARSRSLLILTTALGFMQLVAFSNLPAQRAYWFVTLGEIAKLNGRPLSFSARLLLTLLLVTCIDPRALLSTGLQLSIIASTLLTLSIGQLTLAELLSPFLGTLVLMPVTLSYFAEVNLLSPLTNLLFAPFVAVASSVGIWVMPLTVGDIKLPVLNYVLQTALDWLSLSIGYLNKSPPVLQRDSLEGLGAIALGIIVLIYFLRRAFSHAVVSL